MDDGTANAAYRLGGDSALIDWMRSDGNTSYQKGDYTQVFLDHLRDLSANMDVTDIVLLEIALRLGGLEDGEPKAQGDYTWAIDGRKLYRKPEEVSDEQLLSILQRVEIELGVQKIAPATPIGAIAAMSISEPIYQAVMRTFHYAGVLTKEVDPFDTLNTQVSNTMDHENSKLVVALRPEIRFDKNAVRSLALSLGRGKLGDYCKVVKYDPIYQEVLVNNKIQEIDDEIQAFLGGNIEDFATNKRLYDKMMFESDSKKHVILNDDHPVVIQRKKRLGNDFHMSDYFSNEYTPEYQGLLDRKKIIHDNYLKAIVEAGKGASFLIYLNTDEGCPPSRSFRDNDDEWDDHQKQILTPGDLHKIIRRQVKTSDGSFRTVKAFPGLYNNATTDSTEVTVDGTVRSAIILKFPYLSSRLDMSLQSTLPRLEFCKGCHGPVTLLKMVNKSAKQVTEMVEDPEWDTKSPIDSYTMEIVQQTLRDAGLKTNPEPVLSDSTGLVEVDMSESDKFDFEIAELGRDFRRCGSCKRGWYNVSVTPSKYDYDGVELPAYDSNFPNHTESPVGSDGIAAHSGDFPSSVPGGNNWQRYPGFSNPGQHHDYPLATMHSGKIPNAPNYPNEWFLKIEVKDPNDGRNDTFRGHLETVQVSDGGVDANFADFNRSNSNNLREVERVLGIEAARFCLAHNLAGGQDSTVNYKHYLLLADTMTNGISVKTASSGSSSVRGAASEKGSYSTVQTFPRGASDEIILEALATSGIKAPVDDQNKLRRDSALIMLDTHSAEHYGSVLAQAYERQSEVVLRRAVQGMMDTLEAPISAQIVGIPVRSGTLGNATSGKYGRPNLDAVISVLDEYLTKGGLIPLNQLETMLQGTIPTELFMLLKGEIAGIKRRMDDFSSHHSGFQWWPKEDGGESIGDYEQLLYLRNNHPTGFSPIFENKIERHNEIREMDEFFDLLHKLKVMEKSLVLVRRIYGLDQ
jgi:hypothetical protein